MLSRKIALGLGAVVIGAAPAAAQSLPDLVVNTDRTYVYVDEISCAVDQPLVKVRIAVDNIGDGRAVGGTAVALPNVAAVSVEHAPFTYEAASSQNRLDPGEIAAITIEIGSGDLKAGRIGRPIGGGFDDDDDYVQVATSLGEQRRLSPRLRREIQRQLKARGLYPIRIDGDFGEVTLRGIREFQRSRNEAVTGLLTRAQIDALLDGRLDDYLDSGGGDGAGDRQFEIIIVIDPDNNVRESDEGNNVEILGPYDLNC